MKVKIIRLSKKDAHYHDRDELIGLVGKVTSVSRDYGNGWKSISFIPDNNPWNLPIIHFFRVLTKQVKS